MDWLRKLIEENREMSIDDIVDIVVDNLNDICNGKVGDDVIFIGNITGVDNTGSGVIYIGRGTNADSLSSRFDDVIIFSLPDEDLRFSILSKVGEPMDIENRKSILKEIAKETEGLTGSHLKEIMVYALLLSADDNRETITEDDLATALLKVKNTKSIITDRLSEVNVKCLIDEIKKNKESGK